ncbi:MAG: hypothetical protein AB7I59_12375 [Geminicoccaceae bacterium]
MAGRARVGTWLALCGLPGAAVATGAEWAPARQVEFVIPFGPGGGADMLARTPLRAIEAEHLATLPIVPVGRGGGRRE